VPQILSIVCRKTKNHKKRQQKSGSTNSCARAAPSAPWREKMPNKNCEILWGGRNIALHGLRFEISVFGFRFSGSGVSRPGIKGIGRMPAIGINKMP